MPLPRTASGRHGMNRYIVALTGASGAHFGLRLVWQLSFVEGETDLILSPGFAQVLEAEESDWNPGTSLEDLFALVSDLYGPIGDKHRFDLCGYHDISARAASGSAAYRAMVVAPCSMKTLAAITHGLSQNLIERAADVCLKERRTLILCPRETPLSAIHLENMLTLTRAGAVVMPLMPGYYNRPQTMDDLADFMVDRVFQHVGIAKRTTRPWRA